MIHDEASDFNRSFIQIKGMINNEEREET